MKVSLNGSIKKIIWLLMTSIFFITVVYNESTWGKYAILAASIMIAIMSASLRQGKIKVYIEPFHIFTLLFCGYVLLTSLWAIDVENAVTKATTVFQIFACVIMIYIYYQEEKNVHDLLTAVIWSGYLIALYSIWLYGLDYILGAITGNRIRGAYNNANTIGLAVATSCVLQVNELMNKHYKWYALMLIPAVLVVLATQSRKAIVMVMLGVLLIYIVKNLQNKEQIFRIFKVLLGIALVAFVLYKLSELPVLSTIRERVETMFIGVFGDDSGDDSTEKRMALIEIGWEMFRENPFLGIGFGNAIIIASQRLGDTAYLHNNFLEILCGGGIVGFLIYYAMYVYLAVKLFRHRNADRQSFEIGLVWLILMLVMDYGSVFYYSKSQWLYLMIHFLNVRNLEKMDNKLAIAKGFNAN